MSSHKRDLFWFRIGIRKKGKVIGPVYVYARHWYRVWDAKMDAFNIVFGVAQPTHDADTSYVTRVMCELHEAEDPVKVSDDDMIEALHQASKAGLPLKMLTPALPAFYGRANHIPEMDDLLDLQCEIGVIQDTIRREQLAMQFID